MSRKSIYSGILILVVLALSSLFLISPRPQTDAQTTANCCGPNPPTGPREIVFPYYSLAGGFNSTLLLVSDSPKPLDFVLAIHNLAGMTELSGSMTIQPGAKLPIDMRTLLTSLGADATGTFSQGSVSVYFEGTIMPLVGQMTIQNPARHWVQQAEMVENDPGRSDIPALLSGQWWGLAGGRDATIMVTNASGNTVFADVFLAFGGKEHKLQPLAFNPNETKQLSVADMLTGLDTDVSQAPEGRITIIQHGPNPALVAQGRVTDPNTGFSTTLEFPDTGRQEASALHATGIPIGTPTPGSPFAGDGTFTPHVIASNLSNKPQTVTITVAYPKAATWNSTNGPGGPATPLVRYTGVIKKGEKDPNEALNHPPNPDSSTLTGQLTLAPLTVAADSTADFSLAAVMNQLPLPLPYASIRIQYSGAPGSVISQVSSVDQQQDLVVDARVMNEGDGWAGSGANPWHLDNNTRSILFLTDESDQPAHIGFSVTAGGVHYYLSSLELAPHETRAIDLRELRDAQVADFKGNRIPAGATDGSVDWIRLDNVPFEGRVAVISRQQAMSSSYDCNTCNCPSSLILLDVTPNSLIGVPGGTQQLLGTAEYLNCNSQAYYYDMTNFCQWSSNNASVATVSSGGLATAVAGGSTSLDGAFNGYHYYLSSYYPVQCSSYLVHATDSSSCDVTKLTCGASSGNQGGVARGSTVYCTLNQVPGGATTSNWQFTEGTTTVTPPTNPGTSWLGTAVKGGTVSVKVSSGGNSPTLSAVLTVNARSGWAFTAVSPVKESNGGGAGACNGGLPNLGSPPTATSGDIGHSCLANEWSYQSTQVSDSGPNNGYWYTTSASYSNDSGVAAAYQWERVPDLDNTSSTFYQKQTGTYNAKTNPGGCISGSNLATQTQRHEAGLASSNYIQSHWGQYKAALDNSSNNFGTIIEGRVGPPSESLLNFKSGLDTTLSNANANIGNAFNGDPYGVDHSEYNVFLGYVNYAPGYNTCQ